MTADSGMSLEAMRLAMEEAAARGDFEKAAEWRVPKRATSIRPGWSAKSPEQWDWAAAASA